MKPATVGGVWRGLRGARAPVLAGRLPQRRALSMPPPPQLPVLAIVGTPNAGKSTLFNRLVGPAQLTARVFRPRALVAPLAGTTRDRLEGEGEWMGYRFLVVDTGGIEDLWPLREEEEQERRTRRSGGGHGQGRRGRAHARRLAADAEAGLTDAPPAGFAGATGGGGGGVSVTRVLPEHPPRPPSPLNAPPFAFPPAPRSEAEAELSRLRLAAAVEAQVATAVRQAAVVLFLVDARAGVTAGIDRLASRLRRVAGGGGVRVLVAANKCESTAAEMEAHELWGLGLGEPWPISGLHGRGVGDLLDVVVEAMKEWEGARSKGVGEGGKEGADGVGKGEVGEVGDGEEGGGERREGEGAAAGGVWEERSNQTGRAAPIFSPVTPGAMPILSPAGAAPTAGDTSLAPAASTGAGSAPPLPASPPSPGPSAAAGWSGEGSVGKVALIGRPNVGKSSLLNRLLGRERAVVDSVPGTTRDSISEGYEWRGHKMLFMDTAGIRKPQVGRAGGSVHSWVCSQRPAGS